MRTKFDETWADKEVLIVAKYTFFEESDGFVTEPGSPQLCDLIVDVVAPCWELIFGVKVMISQSSVDFGIWEEKETCKHVYGKALGRAGTFQSTTDRGSSWEEP